MKRSSFLYLLHINESRVPKGPERERHIFNIQSVVIHMLI